MSEPSPEEVDRFLEQLPRERAPLTSEQIETIVTRIREGAVVRTSGYEDYVVVSFRDGRFVLDEFMSYHHQAKDLPEDAVRGMATKFDEFRMVLPRRGA